jgi:hypothetical protein
MFHEMMSHCGMDKLQKTADTNDWEQQQDAGKEGWKLEMHGPTEKWRKFYCHGSNIGNKDAVMKQMKGNTTLYFD